MDDPNFNYVFDIKKYSSDELLSILPRQCKDFSCYYQLVTKKEVIGVKALTSNGIKRFIEKGKLEDKIYLDFYLIIANLFHALSFF